MAEASDLRDNPLPRESSSPVATDTGIFSSNSTTFIGSSDQACKECRRRKARCNRSLPTCDLCIKYRRHCLYEKHSRTPLTRKHLTEVEARLERTETLLRRTRALVPSHLRNWEGGNVEPANTRRQGQDNTAFSSEDASQSGPSFAGAGTTDSTTERRIPTAALPSHPTVSDMTRTASHGIEADHRILEGPPQDDFEWCEKESPHASGLSPDGTSEAAEEENPVSDGMASLTVDEKDTGYLGVASGAALLRLLEPKSQRRALPLRSHPSASGSFLLAPQPNPNRHVAESMIDAYFSLYHVSYPIIHEPTFRAQYNEIIPRSNGRCWTVLAYVVAAIGVWTSATTSTDTLDMSLFSQARSMLGFDFLEVGNLTLVQALTLASNYQQKRGKPNSGYNYLGLAVRMAMGLGLHKEFQGWNIAPLNMEIRRRVWWSLCVFDVGATITFSRPDVWPYNGVEVSFPLNVNDKDLTAASTSYPPESDNITPYTAVAAQARFHIATHQCYERVISKPFPPAAELLRMDAELIETWKSALPPCFSESALVPARYALCQAVMSWRLRNLRILMYRPFVIRRALRRRPDVDEASTKAYSCCLSDAKSTIRLISDYWERRDHNRLAAWYALYFLFQAALIPCICLRNEPSSPEASDWRAQIITTLDTITALAPVNASSGRCHHIISELCRQYLDIQSNEPSFGYQPTTSVPGERENEDQAVEQQTTGADAWLGGRPVEESPQTQINNVFTMMWPNMPPLEAADIVMGDDAGWMEFLRAENMDDWIRPG